MNFNEARQFVAQFVKGEHTPAEYGAFLRWLKGATREELNKIADEHEALHEHWDVKGLVPTADWKARLEEKLDRTEEEVFIPVIGENRSRFLRSPFVRPGVWVAAASVIVLVTAGSIWYAQQGGVKKEIIRPEMPAMTRTVTNPSGGVTEKEVVLADGSKVMLNVASTLKYPEAFNSGDRVVELSGEAYFEVAPNAAKPFRVLIRDAEVDVLGTNFNVRAYPEEPSKTTLIDGSVKVKVGSRTRPLKPGEQAVIAYPSTGEIPSTSKVDVGDVMAWRTGYFRFTNEEFGTVARVLQRYYNVEIQCNQNASAKKVSGSVSRDKRLNENLSEFVPYGFNIDSSGKIVKVTL